MTEATNEAPDEQPEEVSPANRVMALVDAAIAPAMRHTATPGTASLGDLAVILRSVRQALLHVVHGLPADK